MEPNMYFVYVIFHRCDQTVSPVTTCVAPQLQQFGVTTVTSAVCCPSLFLLADHRTVLQVIDQPLCGDAALIKSAIDWLYIIINPTITDNVHFLLSADNLCIRYIYPDNNVLIIKA